MTQSIWIPVRFPSFNEYIDAERSNKFVGAKMKKTWTNAVKLVAARYLPFTAQVSIRFIYYEPSARRDPDAFAFCRKASLDGLVAAKVLPNDTQRYIRAINETWEVRPEKVGVLIHISDEAF